MAAGLLMQLCDQERGPVRTVELHHGIKGIQPLTGLARIQILGHRGFLSLTRSVSPDGGQDFGFDPVPTGHVPG